MPSKVIVPPPALNTGEPEMVREEEIVIVSEVAVKVPADSVKAPFRSIVWEVLSKVPAA